jgi:hypothetical protein
MTGTFISPAAAQVSASTADAAVQARAEGDFFVVITVQKGPAPRVNVSGEGLAGKVVVGGRTVSFDGAKIVLSEGR